jgi:predicted aspartyl protease
VKLKTSTFVTQLLILTLLLSKQSIASSCEADRGKEACIPDHRETDATTIKGPAPRFEGELPFRLSQGYLIEVEGQIGTQARLKFILDTGASISIVDSRIADALNLKRQPATSFNFDRMLAWDQAVVPEVRFGPIKANNVVMLVGRSADYSEYAKNADGIIGLDLLKSSKVTVDYSTKKLVFHSLEQKPTEPDTTISECIVLDIEVQGRMIKLIVDTGFPSILLFEERVRKRVPDLKMPENALNVVMGQRLQAKRIKLPGVLIGTTRKDATVLLTKAPDAEILPAIDGVIGIAALKARRVDLDFTSRKLTWQ